nr:hypothetical protein [Tanacetum cinerariifolium]
ASTSGISPDVAELKDMVRALLLEKKTTWFSSSAQQLKSSKKQSEPLHSKPKSESRLSLSELTPTCMTLELADRSITSSVEIAKDVYVKIRKALIDVFEGELTLHVGKEAITFNLDQTLRYSANYSDMTAKRIDVIDVACEEYSQEGLGFSDTISNGNLTPFYDPIVSTTSPTLTPFGNSDFLLEEVDAFFAVEDEPTSSEFYQPYLDPEGDILLLEAFLNDDPSPPPY